MFLFKVYELNKISKLVFTWFKITNLKFLVQKVLALKFINIWKNSWQYNFLLYFYLLILLHIDRFLSNLAIFLNFVIVVLLYIDWLLRSLNILIRHSNFWYIFFLTLVYFIRRNLFDNKILQIECNAWINNFN